MVFGQKENECMRIGIDCRMINESGVGRYIKNLTENLAKIDTENQYFFISPNIRWYSLSEQIRMPGEIKKLNLDLMHFPHFNVPIFYSGKFVVTIHDLIHQHFNMQRATTHGRLIYKIKQLGYKKIFQHAIKKSQKILVPSNFVRNQLIADWKINPEKIVVTYEAVDNKFLTIKPKKLSGDYIFYVGNAHPHKNVEGLIKAFLKLKTGKLKLVLAGHDHYFWQRIKQDSHLRGNDIVYKGYVSDEELVTLYKNALCFVMPSFEEGFGIPLLEAMALSCPVVSSNAGSLPEVGGDAALYFDPSNMTDMTNKIKQVINNENLRQDLIKKGLKRYKLFSWQKLAEQTLEVYENLL